MAQAPAMPVFTDALLGDTTHLSAEEFGAYCLMLFVTWRNNGVALPDDAKRLSRICRVTERRWAGSLRETLAGFFDLSEGTWRQKRLEKEWRFVTGRAAISRDNGIRGGRPKSLNNKTTENPAGSSQGTQDESPHTHTKEVSEKEEASASSKKTRGTRLPIDFEMPVQWFNDGAAAREKAHLPTADLRTEAVKFANHFAGASGQRGVKLDWYATWINWCLNAKGSDHGRPNGTRPSPATNLFAGTAIALAKRAERSADRGEDFYPAQPLLDRR